MTTPRKAKSKMLYLIGSLKLLKAIVLLFLAFAILQLIGKNLGEELKNLAGKFFFDADNKYLQKALHKAAGFNENNLPWLSAGTFLYAALFFAEGIGLLMQKTWGEWLTVIITGSFLPLEIYELVKEFSAIKTGVLILNVAIVIYLIWRLYQAKQNKKAHT
ncbi:MAG: DUF2127 domain-containing protein [Verrucomicrobiota bacterium]